MKMRRSLGERIFQPVNIVFLLLVTLLCVLPFVYLLSVSLSSKTAVSTGQVFLWPKDFTFEAYKFLYEKPEFLRSFLVSVVRVVLGTSINMLLVCLLYTSM